MRPDGVSVLPDAPLGLALSQPGCPNLGQDCVGWGRTGSGPQRHRGREKEAPLWLKVNFHPSVRHLRWPGGGAASRTVLTGEEEKGPEGGAWSALDRDTQAEKAEQTL